MSNPFLIECCGDSTVAGLTFSGVKAGPPGPTTDSFVPIPAPFGLQNLLQAKYGALATAVNLGMSGTTATDWLRGTGGVGRPWQAYLAATAADVITLCVGLNDEMDGLEASLLEIVQLTKSDGKRLVLQTPNAVDMPAWADAVMQEKVALIRAAAQANSLTLIDFNAETEALGTPWDDELSYSIWEADGVSWVGIHPQQGASAPATGYYRMANAMNRVLDPIVAEALGFPLGRMTITSAVPGEALLLWTWSGAEWSIVNVLDAAGVAYWNERPVSGVSYAAAQGSAGEAAFALPAAGYVLQLAAYWHDAWRELGRQEVTVSPPISV